MDIAIKLLTNGDDKFLTTVAPDVFDHPLIDRWVSEFLGDPRHHLVVALDRAVVVGMASAVHYVHPDKAPELWINEVGVAATHRKRGIGKALVERLLDYGRHLGCTEAWVLTDAENPAALRLYEVCGGTRVAPDPIMVQFQLR
jgi:GNAT superfamily N-acetyltransferase